MILYSLAYVIGLINSLLILPIILVRVVLKKGRKTSILKKQYDTKRVLVIATVIHFVYGAWFVFNTIGNSMGAPQSCSSLETSVQLDTYKPEQLEPGINISDDCWVAGKGVPFLAKLQANFQPFQLTILWVFWPIFTLLRAVLG